MLGGAWGPEAGGWPWSLGSSGDWEAEQSLGYQACSIGSRELILGSQREERQPEVGAHSLYPPIGTDLQNPNSNTMLRISGW